MKLRDALVRLLPLWLRAFVRHVRSGAMLSPDARASFSQEGEDLVLARLFETQTTGYYVDVGAHHPTRFSNTRLLYDRGWRGINIDATPGSMASFRRTRPRDINLEIAVASEGRPRQLFVFDEPALNSLSAELSRHRDDATPYAITETVQVPTRPLGAILSEHLPPNTTIDLLAIDVEGYDLDVLQSNDWERFRPRVLLIEVLESDVESLNSHEEIAFLHGLGYRVFAKLVNSVVLLDELQQVRQRP